MDSEALAKRIRIHAVKMTSRAHASHIAGILSCADIIAVLYADVANYRPDNPSWAERDRIVLSKGHNGVGVYAALAECGFFPVSCLDTYGENGGMFSCHVSHKKTPGVEISTGSLGHGVCMACGMALSAKIRGRNHRVYAIVGDGECNEGSVWEMALLARQKELDNFTVVVDRNGMQALGNCSDILDMEPLEEKWRAFGWQAETVRDGHNHDELREAFFHRHEKRPKVIIAHTVKGKGVSFMENQILWHYRDPQGEAFERAMEELGAVHEKPCNKRLD